MLDPHLVFSLANLLALLCWLGLLISLFIRSVRPTAWTLAATGAPVLFGIAYIVLIITGLHQATGGGFGSIEQVRALFSSDAGLTAGWLHYLAFDLFVGSWIARDGLGRGIYPLLLVPCLLLTFLLGPTGLLLFLILRTVFARRLKPEIVR